MVITYNSGFQVGIPSSTDHLHARGALLQALMLDGWLPPAALRGDAGVLAELVPETKVLHALRWPAALPDGDGTPAELVLMPGALRGDGLQVEPRQVLAVPNAERTALHGCGVPVRHRKVLAALNAVHGKTKPLPAEAGRFGSRLEAGKLL